MRLFSQIRQRKIQKPIKDILTGIVVALVSIPISMGYAQIAGLPVVYGLYGSFLPILIYAFLTTSPQFVVGVDAMPAVMVGGLLASMGIMPQTEEALEIVPVVSFMVAIWFVIFYLFKAGRVVKFISNPVMGGFISGVGITIIMMQIPKLFGGNPGTGEVFELIVNIYNQISSFNIVSFILGIGTIVIILVCKRIMPRIPMTVVMMFVGAILEIIFKLENYGVKLLPEVQSGLPRLYVPSIHIFNENFMYIVIESASIALVIMAQTLLASGSYGSKYGYGIDNNKELLAYAGMNAASGVIGCCPINGSVSRSGIADSMGVKSQLMSISAAISMVIVILLGTPFLKYLPVPILTGIVMTALMGIVDTKMFTRLWRQSRNELVIFILSLIGVLVLGTVNGVIVGCVLAFWEVAIRAVAPPVDFIGRIPGHGNFHSIERNSHAYPIKNTVIYRFNGNLFFANIDKFEKDIEGSIKDDTRQVVIDARGIGSIDITAVDRLVSFNRKLRNRGIKFYITEHASSLNDQIRNLGGGCLIDEGVARRTITLALRDAGLEKPYELEGDVDNTNVDYMESEERLAEFEWAFGSEAEARLGRLAELTANEMARDVKEHNEHISVLENHGATTKWGMLGLFDEHEFWDLLEIKLEDMSRKGVISQEDANWLERRIENRRSQGMTRLSELNPKALTVLRKHRENIINHFKENDPEFYERLARIMEHEVSYKDDSENKNNSEANN